MMLHVKKRTTKIVSYFGCFLICFDVNAFAYVYFWSIVLLMTMKMDDLMHLNDMSIENIISNICERFYNDLPYTMCGKICISLNPFRWLDIYHVDYEYAHIFKVLNEVLDTSNNSNQTVVISGESGSGKTECVKICMKYIMDIEYIKDNTLMQSILSSGPILEYLGNAGTYRNKNSSRFGKFIKLSTFANAATASYQTFLLEKSRVVSEKNKAHEQNYHVFENICKKKGLQQTKYSIMSETCICKFDDKEIQNVFEKVGFKNTTIQMIDDVIGMILQLDLCKHSGIDDMKMCLQLDDVKMFTHESKTIGNEKVEIELDDGERASMLKSLMMMLYSDLFDFVVKELNDLLSVSSTESTKVIGFLDIFGFEDFTKNCFEQFCINFANEKLHQEFLNCAIYAKFKEYEREGIKTNIDLSVQNADTLNVCIEIIDTLETAHKLRSSQAQFMQNVHGIKGLKFPKLKKVDEIHVFCICHFADEVRYNANSFVEKNTTSVKTKVLSDIVRNSKSESLHTLFDSLLQKDSSTTSVFSKSVASLFKNELMKLCFYISNTQAYFVRCISPNKNMEPNIFDKVFVEKQIKYCGFVDVYNIVREVLPKSLSLQKYEHCIPFLQNKNYKVGITKIFGDSAFWTEIVMLRCVIQFQAIIRMRKNRLIFKEIKHRILYIQSFLRMIKNHRIFQIKRQKSILIQSIWKTVMTKRCFKAVVERITSIQHMYKKRVATKIGMRRKSASIIQHHIRLFLKKHKNEIRIDRQELDHLKMQIKILTEELEKQDLWLMRAKRVILLYQHSVKDRYLKKYSDVLLAQN